MFNFLYDEGYVALNIGFYLKKIRSEKNLTLNEVAEKIKLTPSLLSQIEHGKTLPSLTSLETILRFYRINFSDFFRQMEHQNWLMLKKGDIEKYEINNGIVVMLLASKLEHNTLESYLIEMPAGSQLTVKELKSEMNGERFIYSIKGSAGLELPNGSIRLDEGDSINYKSHLTCRVSNPSTSEKATLLINGMPPIL